MGAVETKGAKREKEAVTEEKQAKQWKSNWCGGKVASAVEIRSAQWKSKGSSGNAIGSVETGTVQGIQFADPGKDQWERWKRRERSGKR
ncbi:hypothetical protein [Alteribacillus sp. HJP-4]|uniref:hypothetical protein n=1 Tax=Alteribacillus sp. HJP-4 TaxID=2775394 RepID=UPI0035CD2986